MANMLSTDTVICHSRYVSNVVTITSRMQSHIRAGQSAPLKLPYIHQTLVFIHFSRFQSCCHFSKLASVLLMYTVNFNVQFYWKSFTLLC